MSLTIPNHLMNVVAEPLLDAGYVIAPDGGGNYSAIPSAQRRAMQDAAERKEAQQLLGSVMRQLKAGGYI